MREFREQKSTNSAFLKFNKNSFTWFHLEWARTFLLNKWTNNFKTNPATLLQTILSEFVFVALKTRLHRCEYLWAWREPEILKIFVHVGVADANEFLIWIVGLRWTFCCFAQPATHIWIYSFIWQRAVTLLT